MAGDASFDIVSDYDRQELVNALDQVRREVGTRYDFKGATADLELGKDDIVLKVDSDLRAQAMRDLIESKAIRRGLSLKVFDWGELEPAGGSLLRQRIGLRKGLPEDVDVLGDAVLEGLRGGGLGVVEGGNLRHQEPLEVAQLRQRRREVICASHLLEEVLVDLRVILPADALQLLLHVYY